MITNHKDKKSKDAPGISSNSGLQQLANGCRIDDAGASDVPPSGHKLAVFSVVSLNDLNEEDADPMVVAARPMNDLSKNRHTLNNISSEEMHLMRETMKR